MTSRKRSRAYPAIPLPEALKTFHKVYGSASDSVLTRNQMASVLGYRSGAGGLAARKVAALVQFGLYLREKGRYRPSPLAHELRNALEDRVRQALLKQAFRHPTLFSELLARYRPQGWVPRQLTYVLPEFGIAESVADEVASIFMTSAVYASVLREDGQFLDSETRPRGDSGAHEESLETKEGQDSPPRTTPETEEELRRVPVALAQGKRAFLEVPWNLTEQDVDILESQVRAFSTQVEGNRVAPILPWQPREGRGTKA